MLRVIWVLIVIIYSVKSHPRWIHTHTGDILYMLVSSWPFCVSSTITNEFFCFPDSSSAWVSLGFSGSVAAHDVLFLLGGRGQLFPQTLARWAHTTSQAASCTSSCRNKCATVLRTVLYRCGMQTLALGCSLHSSTNSSLSLAVCLCPRSSAEIRCISKYAAPSCRVSLLRVLSFKHFEGRVT